MPSGKRIRARNCPSFNLLMVTAVTTPSVWAFTIASSEIFRRGHDGQTFPLPYDGSDPSCGYTHRSLSSLVAYSCDAKFGYNADASAPRIGPRQLLLCNSCYNTIIFSVNHNVAPESETSRPFGSRISCSAAGYLAGYWRVANCKRMGGSSDRTSFPMYLISINPFLNWE